MNTDEKGVSRRDFMKTAVTTTIAAGGLTILGAKSSRAEEGKVFKVGLIGCGGRGNGAARNCINAGKVLGVKVQISALADAMKDRADGTRGRFKKEGTDIEEARCFVGFDAYKKLLDTDVEVVIIATSPNFRPVHAPAAIEAGKHVFMEKPVAVDPPGCRKIIQAGEDAKKKGRSIVAGTQRRHSRGYRATQKAVAEGAIGRILGGEIHWCGGRLWYRERKEGWSNAEYLVRNWVSFAEMSGDHIVEQHVHNIDVANWFIGAHPIAAVGFGGRARRRTGDQFDFFSIDYEYPDGVHVHSMCRQINGCWRRVAERLVGEKGFTNCGRRIKVGEELLKYELPPGHKNPYVQEHVDLLDSILKKEPINEAQNVAESTLTAIMGRTSAYTGQRVTWEEMTKSNLTLTPTAADFETGNVTVPKDDVAPIPGKA